MTEICAPMQAQLVQCLVEPGDAVRQGQVLLVLEAMKMEHTITATNAGRLEGYRVTVGEQVAEGTVLVDFVAGEGE